MYYVSIMTAHEQNVKKSVTHSPLSPKSLLIECFFERRHNMAVHVGVRKFSELTDGPRQLRKFRI